MTMKICDFIHMLSLQDVNGTLTKQYSSVHNIQKQFGMEKRLANSFNNGEKLNKPMPCQLNFTLKAKLKITTTLTGDPFQFKTIVTVLS